MVGANLCYCQEKDFKDNIVASKCRKCRDGHTKIKSWYGILMTFIITWFLITSMTMPYPFQNDTQRILSRLEFVVPIAVAMMIFYYKTSYKRRHMCINTDKQTYKRCEYCNINTDR